MFLRQKYTLFSRNFCIFLLTLIIGYYYLVHFSIRPNLFDNSRFCLSETFQAVTLQNFLTEWMNLDNTVDKCAKDLLKSLKIEEFPNGDETKLGILPRFLDSSCNVITLGIGKDVLAEKEISRKLSQCTFLGIDPDAKYSGNLYISDLKGIYVQGVIGANGSSKDVPLENKAMLYPNFSFEKFISIYYPHQTLDYLLMDIEGDEVALMKDLIDYPDKYPIICQINVEYHHPHDPAAFSFFEDMDHSLKFGPYIPVKVETKREYTFNRIFFLNYKNEYCVKKYL